MSGSVISLAMYIISQAIIENAMDTLIFPLLVFSPLLTFAGFYRLWCLTTRKIRFKNKAVGIVYISTLVFVMIAFIYYGWYFFQCVWPGQCGEGFSSGYITAGVILGILITTFIYIISEIIPFIAVVKSNDDDIT